MGQKINQFESMQEELFQNGLFTYFMSPTRIISDHKPKTWVYPLPYRWLAVDFYDPKSDATRF